GVGATQLDLRLPWRALQRKVAWRPWGALGRYKSCPRQVKRDQNHRQHTATRPKHRVGDERGDLRISVAGNIEGIGRTLDEEGGCPAEGMENDRRRKRAGGEEGDLD